jgi:hypothetical protein
LERAVCATRLKFRLHTWGPEERVYGELYPSRPIRRKPTSIPGNRDEYSACCSAELAAAGLYDFLLFSLPDTDNFSHRHGPEASPEAIAKADAAFAKLVEAAGGLDGFLADHALILLADHAQSQVHRELPIIDRLAERWRVLQPSEDRPQEAELAVSPTSRAAHLYLLEVEDPEAEHVELREALGAMEGVDLTCWLAGPDGRPLVRSQPGARTEAASAVVEREGRELRFRPGEEVADLGGGRWELSGDPDVLDASIEEGVLRSDAYPDPLTRVWAALTAPHAGDVIVSAALGYECVDWGGSAHVGGGSHGSLLREDSLGPLLFVGCGPERADEREQWTLRDVAPIGRAHFGLAQEAARERTAQGAAP